MTSIRKEIGAVFGTKRAPNANQLVVADGFDVLEKEGALQFFSGKSSEDVLEHLRSRKGDVLAGAAYELEEWSVLKPSARYYYFRAYLEFLFETISASDPDGGYVTDLFHQLYQTVFMYGGDAYNGEQKVLLRRAAAVTLEATESRNALEEFGDDIADNVSVFLSELGKYD